MADIFDLSSSKISRNSYDDSVSKFKKWESSQVRRDPRIKSPKIDMDETLIRRDPRQQSQADSSVQQKVASSQVSNQQNQSENWMANQVNYQLPPQYNMMPASQPIISNMYEQPQQQQQFNTVYPPMAQGQPSYPYMMNDQRMQAPPPGQEYVQNQYQVPSNSYYGNMPTSDSSYLQAPPPPVWQAAPSVQQSQPPQREIPRAPPPPTMRLTPPPPGVGPQQSQSSGRNQPDSSSQNDGFDKKEAAIVNEMKQQRATLSKQRDEYYQRTTILKRELEVLISQKKEILAEVGANSVPRETQRILKENTKLQMEIQTKLKAIQNVIEMLNGIIGESDSAAEKREKTTDRRSGSSNTGASVSSPLVSSKNIIESPKTSSSTTTAAAALAHQLLDVSKPVYNVVHYDPELHWCRVCDLFPTSAKDYLLHLQSEQHRETSKQHKLIDMPWHNTPSEPEYPSNPDGPVKRTPIKGIQFFIPATAWYCKLCDKWIGDLHCASAHLKSKTHVQNFTNFVEQNPHWETDWITDREKAFERAQNKTSQEKVDTTNQIDQSVTIGESDKNKTRRRHDKEKRASRSSSDDRKKKKKSKKRKHVSSESSSVSSTSTDSSSDDDDNDKSRSIRVAMRNKMKMQAQMILNEELGEKLQVLTKLVEDDAQRKRRAELSAAAQESKNATKVEKVVAQKILPKDKDILTFHAFRNRFKQTQNFKQSQAVSLNLLANKKDGGDNNKSMQNDKPRDSNDRDRQQRDRDRDRDRERERDRERDRDKKIDSRRRYSPPNRSPPRNKYDRTPDSKYRRDRSLSPRHRDRHGSPPSSDRKKIYERYDSLSSKKSNDDKYLKKVDKTKDDSKKKDEPKNGDDKVKFPVNQSKKLPIIGRMPLFKKKLDADEKKVGNKKNIPNKSKFSTNNDNKKKLPAPGLVHVTNLGTPAPFKFTAENPPPPPQIIPDPPHISPFMCALPPHMMEPIQGPVDIPQPMIIMHPEPEQKGDLPPDLQDALNIIFPGDKPQDSGIIPPLMAASPQSESMMMAAAQQYQMMENYPYQSFDGYGMLPSMPPPSEITGHNLPLDIPNQMVVHPIPTPPPHNSNNNPPADVDDLAMLGIDAEDLAAQNM